MTEEARAAVARTATLLDWPIRGDPAIWAVGGGLALVAIYAPLRTLAAPEPLLLGWTAVAAVATLVSPLAGLVILAAIGPFTEALTEDGRITAVPFLLAALGFGFLLALGRLAIARQLPRPPLPIVLAGVLFIGTLLSVGLSALNFGQERGYEALQLWVVGIGGGLTVLFAATMVGWRGSVAPLIVVLSSITVAAIVSIVDVWTGGSIQAGPIGWLVRGGMVGERLGGVIPAPNAFAGLLLVGLAIVMASLASEAGLRRRLLVGLGMFPISAALAFTLSRSALLGIAAIVGLMAWRWRPSAGLLLIGAGIVVAVAASSGIVTARGGLVLPGFAIGPSAGDILRLDGWSAAASMTADAPLTGQGFRSFEWLHESYGARRVDAPHNEWLRLFAEGGIGLGIVGLLFAMATVRRLMLARGWVAAGAAGAAAALFLMATFNNPFLYVQLNVPAFAAIGLGLGISVRQSGSGRPAEE